jgi:hypothetical protein
MDYHIEISSIVQFVNDQIRQKSVVNYNAREIYKHIKKGVLDSETKPFLYPLADGENNSFYEKYARMNAEWDGIYIPDFFEHEGAFYDLDKIQYVFRENTSEEAFRILFSLKIGELKLNEFPIQEFLSFQLFDNFYAEKESFDDFLQELLAIDGNSYLFPSNIDEEIGKWIDKKSASIIELAAEASEIKKNPIVEKKEIEFKKYLESRKGYKIPGKLTEEQIRHFFSFLYLEKSVDKKPFLLEEEVNIIFANGLTIPQEIPETKFNLNTSYATPKKIVEKGIHVFFTKHSYTTRDKNDFLLFFAHYIKDFEKPMYSRQSMINAAGNFNGKSSPKNKIVWDNYLPK